MPGFAWKKLPIRSEEHTSELQSHDNLVCCLLLEKKNGDRPDSSVGQGAAGTTDSSDLARGRRCGLADRTRQWGRHQPGFFFKFRGAPRDLPSSPTRRSST